MGSFGRTGKIADNIQEMKRFKFILMLAGAFLVLFAFKGLSSYVLSTSNTEFVLIIDPGHGGEDTGAISGTNLKEKDITLEISLMLMDVIGKNAETDKNKEMKVILTRKTDDSISTEERALMSNKNKGNLFLSIHANHSVSGNASGFSVFCHEVQSKSKRKVPVLCDEAQNNNVINSRNIADIILKKIDNTLNEEETKVFSMENLGIFQCPLLSLRGINMPAVVLEMGFLSHSMDESFMKDAEFKNRLVNSLADAVFMYKEQYFKNEKK